MDKLSIALLLLTLGGPHAPTAWPSSLVSSQPCSVLHLRGGSAGSRPAWEQWRERSHEADVAAEWRHGLDHIATGTALSALAEQQAGQEDEPEELFRQAFSLTHYRLDFVRSRQLLERLLSLQPHHVPALTTLVATRPHTYAALFGLHHA